MKKASVPRVFEYVDADGNTYWSFTRLPATVSPPKQLVLQDKLGVLLPNFLVRLRRTGWAMMQGLDANEEDLG